MLRRKDTKQAFQFIVVAVSEALHETLFGSNNIRKHKTVLIGRGLSWYCAENRAGRVFPVPGSGGP